MMEIIGWKYYNHAAIPTVLPHEIPNMSPISDGNIYKIQGGTPILARWTTDWDCAEITNWWYVIKDTPFDIDQVKAKRRYEIKRGEKNFDVQRILKPAEYFDEILNVQREAFSAYPEKYRPIVDKAVFMSQVNQWEQHDTFIYGAFSKESGRLCGYAFLSMQDIVLNFNVLKTVPTYEKYGINAAIVYKVLQDFNHLLAGDMYICDGSRNVLHETAFQDYLEKYFGFRKAYCKLHVAYNPKFKTVILVLYKFRGILGRLDNIAIIHKINGILLMHDIAEEV